MQLGHYFLLPCPGYLGYDLVAAHSNKCFWGFSVSSLHVMSGPVDIGHPDYLWPHLRCSGGSSTGALLLGLAANCRYVSFTVSDSAST